MKLEQQLREKIRSQGKADSTADAYWYWVERFLRFAKEKRGDWVQPADMGKRQVEIFLSSLANDGDVSANTQNQAFSALCYLYREVVGTPLENVSALRAKRPQTIRDVIDVSEVVRLFAELVGVAKLVAMLMYASSFRIGEVGRLRMKDISFERRQIAIRNSKGEKSRVVGFPDCIHAAVERQIESMRVLWRHDIANGLNGVSLPRAFGRKSPNAHKELAWWYIFAADNYSKCPHSGRLLRHHIDMGHIGRQIKQAAIRAEIPKRVTSHVLRHSFATHSLENGVPVHVVQALMGHDSLETTQGYLHVTKDGATAAKSPLESLLANPQIAIDRRREDQEPPRLRVWAG
jgi:integron integrase